jgi:hypothetical protein
MTEVSHTQLYICYSDSQAGPSGKAVRQYFPYVSSESDLQRYRAISFHKHPSNETRTGSSISNVPSDSTKTRVSSISCLINVVDVVECFNPVQDNDD